MIWFRVLTNQEDSNLEINVTETRMMRRMYGYTRSDRIRNDVISEKVGVIVIEDKIRGTR